MKGKEQRRLAVQELLLSGYSYEAISEQLNISVSTVGRIVKKIRQSSSHWLQNIAEQDLAHIYREAVEGLRQDMMKLNELLEQSSVKENLYLQLQIRKQITAVRTEYIKQLSSFPLVWSMNLCYNKNKPKSMPQSPLKSLGGITGVPA